MTDKFIAVEISMNNISDENYPFNLRSIGTLDFID
jgi:hypothetical protein